MDFRLDPLALSGNTSDPPFPVESEWAPWAVEAHIVFPTLFLVGNRCSCIVSLLLKASRTQRMVTATRTLSLSLWDGNRKYSECENGNRKG